MNTLPKKYCCTHIGTRFTTNEGYKGTVISGGTKLNYCTIQIENWTTEATVSNIQSGKIKYPMHPSVQDIGYLGLNGHSRKTHKKAYTVWSHMLKRCYCDKYHKQKPSYKKYTVDQSWHNFSIFITWFEKHYILNYELDKDLLPNPSKMYSPKTCMFIPSSLNNFLSAPNSQNTLNTSGINQSKNGNYVARIHIENKPITLGTFKTLTEASDAYKKARTVEVLKQREIYKDIFSREILSYIK